MQRRWSTGGSWCVNMQCSWSAGGSWYVNMQWSWSAGGSWYVKMQWSWSAGGSWYVNMYRFQHWAWGCFYSQCTDAACGRKLSMHDQINQSELILLNCLQNIFFWIDSRLNCVWGLSWLELRMHETYDFCAVSALSWYMSNKQTTMKMNLMK